MNRWRRAIRRVIDSDGVPWNCLQAGKALLFDRPKYCSSANICAELPELPVH
ncbi:MAG TPA: hypothetical protein VHL31_07915 [Geminicoccus sp.]|uniref:hypothetical protein n=1 Tax=Geminicoccus sp. TaxID=2024832 RepID=UPI002E35173C|nr:hypothetical protein [Geminicoccus sp.]HEX2526213.1 hypothetical protein [Geminicoccus sp.]